MLRNLDIVEQIYACCRDTVPSNIHIPLLSACIHLIQNDEEPVHLHDGNSLIYGLHCEVLSTCFICVDCSDERANPCLASLDSTFSIPYFENL